MGVGNFFGMLPDQHGRQPLYGVENWTASPGALRKNCTRRLTLLWLALRPPTAVIFMTSLSATCPLVNTEVNDKAYNKLGFSIHNYFFAKAIDQVRPGGIVAFVTSRYTMDSKDSTARKHMAERADLLGAIRLPNNAFPCQRWHGCCQRHYLFAEA